MRYLQAVRSQRMLLGEWRCDETSLEEAISSTWCVASHQAGWRQETVSKGEETVTVSDQEVKEPVVLEQSRWDREINEEGAVCMEEHKAAPAGRQRAKTIHPTYHEGRGRWSLQGDRWRRHFDWMFWVCSTWVWLKQHGSAPCIVSWVCHQLQKNWRVHLELSRAGSVVERMDWHQASQEGRGWWKEWTGTRLDKRVCAVYLEYVLELFEEVWVSGVVYRRLG